MPRKWRIRYVGARYHVTSRGNGRERIFYGEEDRERFLTQLDSALEADNVVLYAYCLMPNHYHMLVETPWGNIHRFMHRLNTAYGMYFRYKNARPGHCFETRYHAKLAGGDDYLVRLTRYIHLNPLKVKGMEKVGLPEKWRELNGYRWSSYRGYAGVGPEEERVNYRWLGLMGRKTRKGEQAAYRKYVEGFLASEDGVLKEALGASGYAIGDGEFREKMEDGLKGAELRKACEGDIVWPEGKTVGVEEVEAEVAREFGVGGEAFRSYGNRWGKAKAVAIELCCELSGKTQRELATHFGYTSESSVGKQRKLLETLSEKDERLARRIGRLKRKLLGRTF
jgi:putative transposase